ncbi:MAG TPA: universal stress protein [Draconibacterium sp.]|nr:universal stress protein [Draconibacterium sp.]
MQYRSNSILALIPQSKECEALLQQVIFFHHSLQMRVFILNLVPPFSNISKKFRPKKIENRISEAREKLINFIENSIQKNIPEELIVRILAGNVISTLIKESKKGGYEFMVIDKSNDKFPGALSKNEVDKIISRSLCPVLTVNKNFPVSEIKKIVIPIDISQASKKRLWWTTFFAKKYNAKVHIVSALNIDIPETQSLAHKNADKIRSMLNERGVPCEIKILKVHQQERHKVILNYIEEENPELVIIRTHQESIYSDARIGKFVSEIVHGCKMPVFTVGHSHPLPVDYK